MASLQQKNTHLLWRAGFGPGAAQLATLDTLPVADLFSQQLTASLQPAISFFTPDPALQQLLATIGEGGMMQRRELSADQKKTLRIQSAQGLKQLNIAWVNQMVNSPAQVKEKMSLFWHGHFACRTVNLIYQQKLLDIVRNNALGNFGTLLKEVSKSASMLNFLNNNQNRKDHPNENFAREVMELFTLGRGNYTEMDVKEAARAFTGWGATFSGDFVFRERQHDGGIKNFMGRSGNFNGDDILDILLQQRQTARFITRKIYSNFVSNEDAPDRVTWLANRFYDNHYDIQSLLKDIYTSEWFYADKNIGTHIKSPVELWVGIRRMLPMQLDNDAVQLLLQRLLGQVLFYPPNVAGWPGGRNWIDSSTLMMRMRIPEMIFAGEQVKFKPKDDDDQMMGMQQPAENSSENTVKGRRGSQQISASINWQDYLHHFSAVPRESLLPAVSNLLLSGNSFDPSVPGKYSDAGSRENFIKTASIRLMSTPEYQLC